MQDALDNESNVLRLALYGENDTDTSAVGISVIVGSSPGLPYVVPKYLFANNAVDFLSREGTSSLEFLPQVEIEFIDRT